MLLALSWLTFQGLQARSELESARAEIAAAENQVSEGDVTGAIARIRAAHADVVGAADRLGGVGFDVLRPIPWIGTQTRILQDLSRTLAYVVGDADRALVAADRTGLVGEGADQADSGIRDLSDAAAKLAPLDAELPRLTASIDRALAVTESAEEEDMVGPLDRAVASVAESLTPVRDQVAQVRAGVRLIARSAEPGKPLRLLFLAQDSWELRPSGGFIGSYGILELGNGTITMTSYADATTLGDPQPPMDPPEPLRSNLQHPWDLTGAGWWPDFPTSARAAAEMFARTGGVKVDGVIASTQQFLEDLVRATGNDLRVPGYPDRLDADNISDRILYHVELKRPLDKPRKRFLTLLTEELFDNLDHLEGSQTRDALAAFGSAFRARHLQVYLRDPQDQRLMEAADWSGRLVAPTRGDLFTTADANFGTDKANRWVRKKIVYTVSRARAGRLVAHVDITTTDFGRASTINPIYLSYLRVYAPPGSRLVDAEEHTTDVRTGQESGLVTFGAGQAIRPGTSKTRHFAYYLPPSVVDEHGVYRLLIRPQAGTPADTIIVRLDLGGTVVERTFRGDDGDQILTATVTSDEPSTPDPEAAWSVEDRGAAGPRCTIQDDGKLPGAAEPGVSLTPQERLHVLAQYRRRLQKRIDALYRKGCEQVSVTPSAAP